MPSKFYFLTLLLISTITMTSAVLRYRPVFTTTFPSEPLFLLFSKSQKYLACGLETQVDIYNGLTLAHIQTFPLENGNILKGLDFPIEEDKIAFAFQSPDGQPVYQQRLLLANGDAQLNIKTQNHKQNNEVFNISSICYSANSSNILISFLQNLIYFRQQNKITNFQTDQSIIKMACSPTTPQVFAIISQKKVIVYQIQMENSTMNRLFQQQFPTTPTDLSYNDDFLLVSVNDTVHVYQTVNYTNPQNFMIGNFKLNSIVAAKDIFGASGLEFVFLQSLIQVPSTTVDNNGSIFALPYNGYNVLTMTTKEQANLLTKCQQASYYDYLTQTCLSCSDKYKCTTCREKEKCLICKDTYTLNYQGACICPSGQYDSNTTCQLCPYQCTTCTSENTCQNCSETFVKSGSSCVCPDETYQQNKKCINCIDNCKSCKNGNSCEICNEGYEFQDNSCKKTTNVLLIVLLICAGVVVLVIIGFIIFKMKNKSSRNSLLQNHQEQNNQVKTFQ